MRASKSLLRRLVSRTEAQDLIEYGVLIAFITAAVLFTVTGLGVKVPGLYTTTADALPGDSDPGSPGNGNPGRGGNPGNGNPGNDDPVGNPGSGNPGRGGGRGN